MKKVIFIILTVLLMAAPVFGISQGDFVLNIINNEKQIKEIAGEVVLPFDTEYKLRLANEHGRRAVAKITIDGVPVSNLGDFVIPANGETILERFLDRSLTEGKKFKFVRLDHPEVQDPFSKENGIVKVEFRLEKKYKPIKNDILLLPIEVPDSGFAPWTLDSSGDTSSLTSVSTTGFTSYSINCSATVGATVGGSESKQAFHKIEMDLEDSVTTLTLKMLGISLEGRVRW